MIDTKVCTVKDFFDNGKIVNLIADCLKFSDSEIKIAIKDIRSFLSTLKEDLDIVMETGYVDFVYRDCYYYFYSKKHRCYLRDCVRLSFFEKNPMITALKNSNISYKDVTKSLTTCYKGFLVLRPLVNGCIGRNCLDSSAKKEQNILICKSAIDSSCLGLKLKVNGFPHSSQDGEYMSCAETTVWEIMEYYGNKYSCYRPILPSAMLEALSNSSYEKQTPTTGLRFEQISLLLKKQGFESTVYYCENPMFKELFTCYIESGFPLAVCLTNSKGMGHAVVCIGRAKVNRNSFTQSSVTIRDKTATYFKWNNNLSDFIFNDDNYPPYQKTTFNQPLEYYEEEYFKGASITNFIVPLPKKVFLDAENAIKASDFFSMEYLNVPNGSYMKTFLVSCRSFREHIVTTESLDERIKTSLLRIELPKFIWITEISQRDDFQNHIVSGLILLDATGNINEQLGLSSLLWVCYDKKFIFYDRDYRGFKKILLPSQPIFKEYSNLK